ncbi:MAG: hypothetical protein ACK5N8_08465 [Alphaproteobacteria bacterium]
MVKATHYDVYVDYGNGWSLEQRFSEESRLSAYALVKEKETLKAPVKVVCEIFDEIDNTYSETVEYVSGLSLTQNKNFGRSSGKNNYDYKFESTKETSKEDDVPEADSKTREAIFLAIIKIFIIIAVGIFLTNIFVSLFYPIIERLVPLAKIKTSMFLVFFILFTVITIPLLLTKVPWDVFLFYDKKGKKESKSIERNAINRALEILSVYDLNTEQFPVAPVARNVSFENKQEIVSFLSYVVSVVDQQVLTDNFLKLGLRFILYGACIELAKYRGLSFAQANALLFEAFGVIDGEDNVDLEDFYEAKMAYKNVDTAVLMAGIGAYIMHNMLQGKHLKENYLNVCLNKWELLKNPDVVTASEEPEILPEVAAEHEYVVNIKSMIKFEDNQDGQNEAEKEALLKRRDEVRTIIFNMIAKFNGGKFSEEDNIASIYFSKIDFAVGFVMDVLRQILEYQDEINDRYVVFYNTCNLVSCDETDRLKDYVKDIFIHNYNNEIILTKQAYDAVDKSLYSFEGMGNKHLESLDLDVELYKLIY